MKEQRKRLEASGKIDRIIETEEDVDRPLNTQAMEEFARDVLGKTDHGWVEETPIEEVKSHGQNSPSYQSQSQQVPSVRAVQGSVVDQIVDHNDWRDCHNKEEQLRKMVDICSEDEEP